jgi:hypothetical protein
MSTGTNTRISVTIHSTATREELWEALSRVLPVVTGGSSQWVELFAANLSVVFFGPGIAAEPDAAAVAEPAPVTA